MIVAVVLVLAALVVWFPVSSGSGSPAFTEHDETLLDASFSMPSGTTNYYAAYQFSVPSSTFEATMEGNFTVQQIGGEGVELFVMSPPQFAAFQADALLNVTDSYDTGPTAGASFSAALFSPGAYYLVFAEEPLNATLQSQISAANMTVKASAQLVYTSCGVC